MNEQITNQKQDHYSLWHFFAVLISTIITIGMFYGLFFAYQLSRAEDRTLTENFSGGAPALNNNLPKIEESNTNYDSINILLLGNGGANHPGGALCDVIQVLSINTKSKKALMVSIPRDLFVDIDGSGHKINEMYFRGEAKGKGMGGGESKKIVGTVMGIPIHYYIKIDFAGFKKVIDILGGVDVNVDKGISDSTWGYYIKPGQHHFNGTQALDFVRSRYSTSDFDRSARQQKMLIAVRDKILMSNLLSNPSKINEIINTLSTNLKTDVSIEEMVKIMYLAQNIPDSNISNYVFETGSDNLLYSTITRGGAYGIFPVGDNYDKIHEFIKTKLP